MSSLLAEINSNVQKKIEEEKAISKNIDIVLEKYGTEALEFLNEAVTNWLVKVRNKAKQEGGIDPRLKDSISKILGALMAISNPDLADALDERGNLGQILYAVSTPNNKDVSNAALRELVSIGSEPSLKSFVEKARRALDNPEELDVLARKIQTKIEPVMNKKLSQMRKRQSAKANKQI